MAGRRRFVPLKFEPAQDFSRPSSRSSVVSSASSVYFRHVPLVDLDDLPAFSSDARRCMEHTVDAALSSREGKIVWRNVYSLLREYASEPDWTFTDTLAKLYNFHFPEAKLNMERDFLGGGLRRVIRQLHEWVDSWFDPTGAVRVRLRRAPLPANKLRGAFHIKYRVGPREKQQLKDGFEPDEDVEGVQQCVRLPPAPPHVPSAFGDGIRLNIFTLILMHFPNDGLELNQIHQAYQVMFGGSLNFGIQFQTTAHTVVTSWMSDVLSCKRVSPYHDIVRLRLDAPGLFIEEGVLKEYRLAEAYASARQVAAAAQVADEDGDAKKAAAAPLDSAEEDEADWAMLEELDGLDELAACELGAVDAADVAPIGDVGGGDARLLDELLLLPCMRRSNTADYDQQQHRPAPVLLQAPPPGFELTAEARRQPRDSAMLHTVGVGGQPAIGAASDATVQLRRLIPKRQPTPPPPPSSVASAAPPIQGVMQRLRLPIDGSGDEARVAAASPTPVNADWPTARFPPGWRPTAPSQRAPFDWPSARRPRTADVAAEPSQRRPSVGRAPAAAEAHDDAPPSYADAVREQRPSTTDSLSARPLASADVSTVRAAGPLPQMQQIPSGVALGNAVAPPLPSFNPMMQTPFQLAPVAMPSYYGQLLPFAYQHYMPLMQQIAPPVGYQPPPPPPPPNWEAQEGIRRAYVQLLDAHLLAAPQRSLLWSGIAQHFPDTRALNYIRSVVTSRQDKFNVEFTDTDMKITLILQ